MKLTESRLRTLIEEELEKARAMIKIGPNQYYRDETIEFIRRLKEKHPGIDKRMIEKLATLNRLPGRAGIPRQQSETIAAAMEKYLVIDSGIPDGETIKRGIPSPRGGFTLDNMIRALDAAAKSTYKGPKGPGFPTMPGGTINEQAEPNNAFDALRVLEPYEFLKITPDSFKVFLHRGRALGSHYHAYVIVDGRKVIAPDVITTDGDPIGAQGDSESEAMGTLWNSIKAARPKASKLTRAAAKPQPQKTKQTTGRKINITNKQIGNFIVATAEYPMRGKLRKQYAQAKIINGNTKAASEKATEEVRKRVEAILASEPPNTQDQATRKKNIRDKTIAGQVPEPAPASVANAFDPELPGAAGSGAKPVQAAQRGEQGEEYDVLADVEQTKAAAKRYQASQAAAANSSAGEFDGLGTRSILRKKFPGMSIRAAFEKLKKLPFRDPARVAYRDAYGKGNRS